MIFSILSNSCKRLNNTALRHHTTSIKNSDSRSLLASQASQLCSANPVSPSCHPNRCLHLTTLERVEDFFDRPDQKRDVFIYPLGQGARHILLNRPSALNALSLPMVRQLSHILDALTKDKDVSLVVMSGRGDKAFCAGGDVVALHKAGLARKAAKNQTGDDDLTKAFFRSEYSLNFKFSHMRFPLVSVLNGIVMGGGVGISCHGRYRAATPQSLFAMPECAIGFFPDVGASFLLPRLHYPYLGYYLGLTGARLKGYDLVHAGIATHWITVSDYTRVVETAYSQTGHTWYQAEDAVENIFWHLSADSRTPEPTFSLTASQLNIIAQTFSKNSIEEIISYLKELSTSASDSDKKFISNTLKALESASPISLKVTLELLQRGSTMDLADCLSQDYRVSQRFMLGEDFYSGVSSMLITKDKKPQWSHTDISAVSKDEVESYFQPLTDQEELVLNYPTYQEPQWYI